MGTLFNDHMNLTRATREIVLRQGVQDGSSSDVFYNVLVSNDTHASPSVVFEHACAKSKAQVQSSNISGGKVVSGPTVSFPGRLCGLEEALVAPGAVEEGGGDGMVDAASLNPVDDIGSLYTPEGKELSGPAIDVFADEIL